MSFSGIENLLISIRSGQLIGNQLIDLFKNAKIIDQIHEKAKDELKSRILSHRNKINKEIIILSLSIIAFQHYTGNFWDYVEEAYGHLFDIHPTRTRVVISDILNNHIFKEYTDRNIDVAIMFSIVPLNFMPDFFDFLFDIYKTNFSYSLKYINLEKEFEFIYTGLSSKMLLGKDTDVSIDVTGRTYQLIKATQRIIQHKEFYKEIISFSITQLKLIDSIYQDIKHGLKIDMNDYPEIYRESISKLTSIISKKDDKLESEIQQQFTDDYLFDFTNNNIYLQVPNFRIHYSDGDIFDLLIYIDNKIVWSKKDIKIRYFFGGHKTVVNDRINLTEPFGQYQIEVRKNSIPIQDLTIKFNRYCFVFDNEGKEIYRSKYGTGTFIIADTKIVDESLEAIKLSKFEVSILNVKDYKAIKTSYGEIIEFGNKPKNGIVGNEHNNVVVAFDNHIYSVYKEIYAYYYTCEYPSTRLRLLINDIEHDLMNCSDIDYKNHQFTYRINLEYLNIYGKVNKLIVIDKSNNNILVNTYLFIDKTLEIIGKENNVKIISDMKLLELNKDQELLIKSDDTFISTSFVFEAKRFIYKIALPFYKIKFENLNIKTYQINNTYWHKDLNQSNKLLVYGINLNEVVIIDEKRNLLTRLVNKYSDFINEIDISSFRNYTTNDFISIVSKENFEIKIHFKPKLINKNEFIIPDYNKGTVTFLPEGIGLDSIYIDIFDKDELILTNNLNENIYYNFVPFRTYSYTVYSKEFIKKTSISSGYIHKYKYSLLTGFGYKITKMLHEPQIDSKNYEMKEIFTNNKVVLFKKYLGEATFVGNIGVVENDVVNELPFNVKIEIEGEMNHLATKLFITHFEDKDLLSLNKDLKDMYIGDYEEFNYATLPQIDFFIISIKGGIKYD